MNEKSLAQDELEVLDLIRKMQAEPGPVLRTALSVSGRGRGLEVARPLIRLKSLGLVEEVEQRPFFLLRWFGASTKIVLRLTPAADALAASLVVPAAEVTAATQPHAVEDIVLAAPMQLQPLVLEPVQAAQSVAPQSAPQSMTPPPLQVSDHGDRGAWSLPQDMLAAEKMPEAEPEALAAPEPVVAEAAPAYAQPVPEPLAQLSEAEVELAAEPVFEPVREPAPEPAPERTQMLAPEPAAEPEAEPAPQPVPKAAVHPAFKLAPSPAGYTDDIGGAPLSYVPVVELAPVDPNLLENLREVLSEMGMELTIAGDALIADRVAKGATLVGALMEVIVFAFAHAARYDSLSDSPAQNNDLLDYAGEVVRELHRLREVDAITDAQFDAQSGAILALADNASDRSAQVDQLLADPIGGSAPPALLPEELRGLEEIEDEAELALLS